MAAGEMKEHAVAPEPSRAAQKPLATRIGRAGVEAAVHAFYTAVRRHAALGPVFGRVVDWDDHEARMALFWWTALGGRPYSSYCSTAVPRDAAVRIPAGLVGDWERLLHDAIRRELAPAPADEWIARTGPVVAALRRMGEYYERHGPRRG
ncbi:MAG TPA: hypothetical protein VF265_03820 [Nevskiaceae bacterium]